MLVNSSDQYFDDCPICQAMKKAEKEKRDLTEKEVKKAFKKAKKVKDAVVGDFSDKNQKRDTN